MLKLRPYQYHVIDCIKKAFESTNKQYIVMPTGAGKTFSFLSYAKDNHKKILVIVPSIELLNQVYDSALFFFDKGHVSRKGGDFEGKIQDVHICTIQSTRNGYIDKLKEKGFDLIIIDEAHHSLADSYQRLISVLEDDNYFLGVTATPERSDGVLENVLKLRSCNIEIHDLIEQGFLSDLEGYRIKTHIDINDVDSHNGDFSINELYKKLCTDKRNQIVLDAYKKLLYDRKTLVFCINIKHSQMLCKLFNDQGISSMHIDGSMDSAERKKILDVFRAGAISCLFNCQLLTEGFDEPSVDGLILARPTRSRALFRQMIGRGLRTFPGKENCIAVDIADSHRSTKGFTSITNEESYFHQPEHFSGIKSLREHINREEISHVETSIERADLIAHSPIRETQATFSMKEYIEKNGLYLDPMLDFDEGAFIVWYNELKKEILCQ